MSIGDGAKCIYKPTDNLQPGQVPTYDPGIAATSTYGAGTNTFATINTGYASMSPTPEPQSKRIVLPAQVTEKLKELKGNKQELLTFLQSQFNIWKTSGEFDLRILPLLTALALSFLNEGEPNDGKDESNK